MMRLDPGNKLFITVFTVFLLAVIGFLIASIFVDFTGDKTLKTIEFKSSKFWISIKQQKDDKRAIVEIYNGEKWLQKIKLGTDFAGRTVEVVEVDGGWKVRSSADNEISFYVDVDSDDFSSLYIKRKFSKREAIVTDCLFLDSQNNNWYGGPEQKDQRYPIQKFNFSDYAYVTKELDSAAIMERYWLSSTGFFILFDYSAPLFIDQNTDGFDAAADEPESIGRDHICFTGKKALPFYIHNDDFEFSYRIGAGKNARETHLNVINRMLGKPLGMPDERVVRYPIWNTWVRYNHWKDKPINQSLVADFAEEIAVHGFKYSLLDIDDMWEVCYGSLEVSKTIFPDMKALTADLKSKGWIMGMWVHPFINKDCNPHYNYAKENDFLVKSYSGSTNTSWWRSEGIESAHVDFTNPAARSWFRKRLENIQRDHGIDIFKFDAGETSWYPEDPVLTGDKDLTPSQITRSFVELASDFGNLLEIRTGWGTQHLSVLVRMLDFDSRWGVDNGLKSLIPTLIQFNMNGYVFVLPDMIGGNQYDDDKITKELFIRWLQASVFMPSLQFSWAPWDFDQETVELSRKFVELHEEHADYILERFALAVSDGHPVNPPIWFIDPEDKVSQIVADEFLLGEKILAAPVIEQGATERNIYLPAGRWTDGNTKEVYEGKQWIMKYQAPIGILPYFIREDES